MGETRPGDAPWVGGLAIALIVFLLAGGTSAPTAEVRLALTMISLVGVTAATWRLRHGLPNGTAKVAVILGLCAIGLFLLQLVPLPGSVQPLLSGRAPIVAAFEALGAAPGLQPLSLSPRDTEATLLAMVPAIFMFLAVLSVAPRHRSILAGVFVAVVIASCLVGVAQRFSTSTAWQIYEGDARIASGFFANRNFFAALLYTSIPMLGAFALSSVREQKLPGWLAAILGFVYLAIILAGLAAAQSRSGIILSMAAIVATALLPWGSLNSLKTRNSRRLLIYGALTFLFIFSQFGLAGILRLVDSDPMADYRTVIMHVSWKALVSFFPVGSGFGTFVPVYQMFEAPADLRPEFVNHAHNDWMEIVSEGGLPALILLVAFVIWFVLAALRIWSRRSAAPGDLVMPAASISAGLLLLHSAVDYPLRTPALMSLFGLYLGLMAAAFSISRRPRPDAGSAAAHARPMAMARKPFTPFKPKDDHGDAKP